MKINFQSFIDKHKNDLNIEGKNMIIPKSEIKTHFLEGWVVYSLLKEPIEKNYDKIVFGFRNSIIVLDDGSIISNGSNKFTGSIFNYKEVIDFTLKEKGFLSKGEILDKESNKVGNTIGLDRSKGFDMFKKFQSFLIENPPSKDSVHKLEKEKNKPPKKNSIEQKSKSFKKVVFEVEEVKDEIKLINKEKQSVENYLKDIVKERKEKNSELIKLNNSYKVSLLLNSIPYQCSGSVIFYNQLNEKKEFFDQFQFNKIIRFLDYIEEEENKYYNYYLECSKKYLKIPDDKIFVETYKQLEYVYSIYKLMELLVSNVDKDQVLFNKTYNLIEDKNIFLTKSEKKSFENLNLLVKEIKKVNINLVEGFRELSSDILSELGNIEGSVSNMSDTISNLDTNFEYFSKDYFKR